MNSPEEQSSPPRSIASEVYRVLNEIHLSGSCSDNMFDDSDVDPDFHTLEWSSDYFTKVYNRKPKSKKYHSTVNAASSSTNNHHASDHINLNETANERLDTDVTEKVLTRKKQRNPLMWRKNINKNLRNQGREYEGAKGNVKRSRRITEGCTAGCIFKCSTNFSDHDRQKVHDMFWSLSSESKLSFYSKFTKRVPKERKRTKTERSRRQDTFLYYFEKNKIMVRICKVLFLTTLDISQNRIYHFHKTKATDVGTTTPRVHGKHVKFKICEEKLNEVRDHIKSFPTMESHYCRATSKRQYLEGNLTISRMYCLYLSNATDPVKLNIYSKVFNEQFNLAFYKPKKDQCDRCVAHKVAKLPTADEILNHQKHELNNKMAKTERDSDRHNIDEFTAVLCYDLQNVFALPRANVSNFFYKRKFSVYNLTAHCSSNKFTYCAIWHEAISGRAGNDLASALIKILKCFVSDNPTVKKIILWSDSCIPQNRNRITSLAILKFIQQHPHIMEIQQKFSEPGHSQVQEIDAVHSSIERFLRNTEIHSPVTLITTLKAMNFTKVTLVILQMKIEDFQNYNAASVGFVFPPFCSVCHLIYEQANLCSIKYRIGYNNDIQQCDLIRKSDTRKQIAKRVLFQLPTIGQCVFQYKMSAEKKKDIRSMLNYMPEVDKRFYEIYVK